MKRRIKDEVVAVLGRRADQLAKDQERVSDRYRQVRQALAEAEAILRDAAHEVDNADRLVEA